MCGRSEKGKEKGSECVFEAVKGYKSGIFCLGSLHHFETGWDYSINGLNYCVCCCMHYIVRSTSPVCLFVFVFFE